MTYASVPALRVDDAIAKEWTPLLAARSYDPGVRARSEKTGALAGMGMTEKQGGSDVRTNVTQARPTAEDGWYTLHGHKWFTSAPMNDVFLVLAQAEGGVTCFVVPRVLADGTRNRIDVVRLKDKLGNRSNASSELELDGTLAQRLGDEGRGVRTIIEMVAATRLDCVLGSAALMRHALAEASWHVAHRSAFGSVLADKPLMQNVVADLAVESEAATALAMRLAAAVDRPGDAHEAALRRIALPLAKFWVCKRTPGMVAEALECLGGNGYVEESGMPLMFRESPLNSIWEGSGNVNALDVLRALGREPEVLQAWITEVGLPAEPTRGSTARSTTPWPCSARAPASRPGPAGSPARWPPAFRDRCSSASSPAEVADAFCGSRLGTSYNGTFGMLTSGSLRQVVERAHRRLTTCTARQGLPKTSVTVVHPPPDRRERTRSGHSYLRGESHDQDQSSTLFSVGTLLRRAEDAGTERARSSCRGPGSTAASSGADGHGVVLDDANGAAGAWSVSTRSSR